MKTLLLTNDDGYLATGIQCLKEYLEAEGEYDIYIVAPESEQSGISIALTINRPLRINRVKDKEFVVDGTPADCVNVGVQKLLPRKPDFVISGMNLGENLAEDVFFSGTVGAAFSGYLYDVPSLAVSLISDTKNYNRGNYNLDAGCRITARVLKQLLAFPDLKTVYNVNIPYENNDKILVTSPGRKRYRPDIVEKIDPRDLPYYWIGTGNPTSSGGEGTDVWAVKNGFISLTPLRYDLTDDETIKKIEGQFDES